MTCSEAAVSCIQLMGRPWLVMFLDLVHWSQQVYTEFAPHVSIPSVASAWVAKVNFGRYSFGHCIWYKVKNEAACLHWTITQVPSSSQYTTYFLLNSYTWSRTGAVWVPEVNKGSYHSFMWKSVANLCYLAKYSTLWYKCPSPQPVQQ